MNVSRTPHGATFYVGATSHEGGVSYATFRCGLFVVLPVNAYGR